MKFEVSNLGLKISNYSIKKFSSGYRKTLYDNRKDFGNRRDLHDRELYSLWCSKGGYSQHFLQRFILLRLNIA